MSHKRASYTSDLNDAQWETIAPLLPIKRQGRPGCPLHLDMREVVNAMLYVVRVGCQ